MLTQKKLPAARTRIQQENQTVILNAALEIFATYGLRGTTIDQIAEKSGLSKPNLLYYFRRKDDIYTAVLQKTLTEWLQPLRGLNPDGDPITEIANYITTKLDMSFEKPLASKLFANEILSGAPHIKSYLEGSLKDIVEAKVAILTLWSDKNLIKRVDPYHYIFTIWAVTQHYSDFAVQVNAILGAKATREKTTRDVLEILLGIIRKD